GPQCWGGHPLSSASGLSLCPIVPGYNGAKGGRDPGFLGAPPPSREEIFPRDSNLKDKFIKHFTGPVSFSAECSKHFHRLYHNTRDCSTPAYYKRCARLLTRLAMSPLCTQP
uniref:ALK and LTK ligand 1 n=1 Tax=Pelusios castaneus TaxID=367368 RepID=A0A8C8S9L4_9SAUR